MTEKTCLVTGGNGGIGFETAKALVEMGADIIIVAGSRVMRQILDS